MAFAILCRIIFAILILLPISTIAQTNLNITLGSSIVANRSNSTWLSPSGEFAFGFQQIVPGGYLLAIWFNNIPERTIVWSANRDNLAEEGSIIQLFQDGRFELNDPRGQQIWAANLPGPRVAYAAMLDTGNFVLASNTSRVVWQSFDEPTDTLLPGQTLNQGGDLVASFSETNYSSGRFSFAMQTDGNLVFYTRNFPMNDNIFAYTATQTVGSGYQVVFNQSGFIFLAARNGTILSFLSSDSTSSSQFYQRAILEYDGVLRHYVYPRFANSTNGRAMGWSVSNFLPSNICNLIEASTGPGACGFNSFCSLGTDQRPNCGCPYGYSQVDPNDRMSGCKLSLVPQSCDRELNEIGLFGFIEMLNTDWPGSDYDHFGTVNEDWCRQACLDDCFCAVAIYNDRGCWKKKLPLSNGRVDSSLGATAFLKFRRGDIPPLTPNVPIPSNQTRDQKTLIIVGSALLGSSVFINFILIGAACLGFFLIYSKKIPFCNQVHSTNLRCFTYKELVQATNGFKEELGRGAFGIVYKGDVPWPDGSKAIVAVKKLDSVAQDTEKEFRAEVNAIGQTHHKNLVRLIGFCDEGPNRLLVYEYMSNGTLADFLFNNMKPSWNLRTQIAMGVARGLTYLHEECSNQIIHCDIKPQNILLDEYYNARISDFGLAKLLMINQSRTLTNIRGTKGYVAPEWFRNTQITAKVDVYSFGVLLLEIISCRKSLDHDLEFGDGENPILTDWVWDSFQEKRLESLVNNDVEALRDREKLERFLLVGIWCIQEDSSLRPTMRKASQMLEGILEVAVPPCPSPFSSTTT